LSNVDGYARNNASAAPDAALNGSNFKDPDMNDRKSKPKSQPLLFLSKYRKLIAFVFFVLVAGIAVRHVVVGGGPTGSPDLCAYCPMGAISSLYVYLVHGQFLHRIHPTSFVVLGAVLLVTLLSRRAFCGWICPFGTLQEWLRRVGKKLSRRRMEPPPWLDRSLRYLKYVVLLSAVGGAWYVGTLVFRTYDPYLALFDFGESLSITWPGYVILVVVIVGALAIERVWCRYACPLGALLGLLSKVGMMKITHEEGTCTNCKAGIHRCPMGINPALESDLRSAECIQCMECVAVCPIHNAVHVEAFGKRMRPALIGVSIAGAFVLVIGAAQYLGAWQTVHGGRGRIGWSADDIGGAMVTGSMTLDDVREAYQLDESDLRQHLGIDETVPMDRPIRDFRDNDREEIPSPNEIQTILEDRRSASATVERESVLLEAERDPTVTTTSVSGSAATSTKRENVSSDSDSIRGWMTLEQIRALYGMEESEFRRLIDLPASVPMDTPVRDLEMLGDETLPSTEDIREVFATFTPVATPPQTYGRNRATAPSGTRRSSPSSRPRGMGGGRNRQTSPSSLQNIRGSTTLREALAYSGKTLEQVKKDWNLSFVDPQTNLGTLARTLGVPMWELRAYFQK
jgi:ferredoxin